MSAIPLVRLIDDDESFRTSQKLFLETMGWFVATYESAAAFLAEDDLMRPGCLILDVRMPEMTGIELQKALNNKGVVLPVIFLTGHGDVSMAVHTLKHGAYDFLEKPVEPEALHRAVEKATLSSLRDYELLRNINAIRSRYDSLTPREREVILLAAQDMPNKVIASSLAIGLETVKMHRANAFAKLGAKSALDAYRLLERLGLASAFSESVETRAL